MTIASLIILIVIFKFEHSMVGWDEMQWNPSFKCFETSNAGITLRSIPAYGPVSRLVATEAVTAKNDE